MDNRETLENEDTAAKRAMQELNELADKNKIMTRQMLAAGRNNDAMIFFEREQAYRKAAGILRAYT